MFPYDPHPDYGGTEMPHHHPSPELLFRPEVEVLTRLGRTSIYRLMNDPDARFPRPIRLGARRVAWRRSEVMDWLENRPRCTAGQPA